MPFAAGILPENGDVDHPVASALAVEVIAQRAYHPIGEGYLPAGPVRFGEVQSGALLSAGVWPPQ